MLDTTLREVFGQGASFRDESQRIAVEKIVDKKRILVVQKTGWGKSLVYFLATKIMRRRGEGATIIISPLLSLTRNQIESTKKYGIIAESINSQLNKTQEERIELVDRCNRGLCDVLFITPEQLAKQEFIYLLSTLKISLFVVDEAHCISDWGHDFRPDYLRIKQLLDSLPSNVGILATTATANDRVVNDIVNQIGNCEVIRGPLERESLYLHKVYLPSAEEKYAWLAKNIVSVNGSGIIYATTVKECIRIAEWLRTKNIKAYAYYSELKNTGADVQLEKELINNEVKVLVCTIALGMGFDKKDISFVIHYYTPKSVIEYYQQIGRAGRDIPHAYCILLYGGVEEERINSFFIENSFPKQEDILEVIMYLINHNDSTSNEISLEVNLKNTVLNQILKLLMTEGFIAKEGTKYYRTAKVYQSQKEHYDDVILTKKKEYSELCRFREEKGCLMNFITNALNDPHSAKCGNCSNCLLTWSATVDSIEEKEKEQVRVFFSDRFNYIEPRKKSVVSNKNLRFKHEKGFALSNYYEEIGQVASKCKYESGEFSNILVDISVRKIKSFFRKEHYDMSNLIIIPIPSNRRPNLVPMFASKLASILQCGYAHILAKRENEPEQKGFLNSSLQEMNIRNYLYIKENVNLSNRTILLVDDFVDSRWSFAVASELLGIGFKNIKVIPFAIANTSGSD